MGFTRRPIAEGVRKVSQIVPVSDPKGQFLYVDLSSVDKDEKRIVWDAVQQLSWEEAPSRARQIVHAGDILVSTVRPNLNGVAQLEPSCDEAIASTGFCVLRANPDVLDPRYLFHWLCSPKFIAEMVKLATGASYPAVSDRIIHESLIPLPSDVSEQRRIAAILDKADAIRKKRRDALMLTDEFLRSIFLDMFGDPQTNPKGWPIETLRKFALDGDKINYGVVQPGDDLDEGVPLVRVGDLNMKMTSTAALKRISPDIERNYVRSRLVGDEILIGCVGSVGRLGLASPALKGANIARAVARFRPSKRLPKNFLFAYLSTPFVQRFFQQETRTVSQPTLNIGLIEETPVIVPPHDLAQRFDKVVEQMQSIRERQDTALIESEQLFSSLSSQIFIGPQQ